MANPRKPRRNGRKNDSVCQKEEKPSLRERLCREWDLSPDLLSGGTLIEIRDQHRLILRGGGKILRYTEEEVCVALRKGCLSVRGKRLFCNSYHIGAVSIEGFIQGVIFVGAVEENV